MFAEVVFPLPFRNTFTYSVPVEFEDLAKIGVRVVAPFGKRVLTGFVVKIQKKTSVLETIRPLSDILDAKPIYSLDDLKFYEWLAEYYVCSLGEALRLGVPYGLEIESKRKILIDKPLCKKLSEKEKNKTSLKTKILNILSDRDEMNFSYLQKMVGKKNIYSVLKSLENDTAVTLLDEIEDAKVKVKTANFVKLAKPLAEIYVSLPELEQRSPKQLKILLEIISNKKKEISMAVLLKKVDASRTSIDSLQSKGLVSVYEKEVDRKYSELYNEELVEFTLTDLQLKAIEEVKNEIDQKKFKPFLLHGITGSGKTQVYIELIKEVLIRKKTALILVPEISLTPQITSRLLNNFGDDVSVMHSRMSLGERYDSWRRILKGKSKIVIGARSALFAPLKNIGIIIVDEEHDQSYKQTDSAPKYNARDSAVVLARFNNCPVLLGSATPSFESMFNAETGKYKLLELPERIDNAKLPKILLVNVSIERKNKKMENVFSGILLDKIKDRLTKKEGVIILQNRRGFSTQIFCEDCSEVETCPNCSVPMVYHISKNYIQCHYCGFVREVPNACTHCGSINIKYYGTGTERVEDELEFHFPGAVIKRVDSDSIGRKSSLSKTLLEFSEGNIDILVGTQMVSKGLDFSRVTLVGVISAETSLWIPDFRADERTFQLLTQVSGRAGRSNIEGEVIIQTQNEKTFTLQKVLQNDYMGFYKKEMEIRLLKGYPPFSRICLVETKDLDENKAKGAINDFYQELVPFKKWLNISLPTTALIAKLKGHYRFNILIKSSRDSDPGGAVLRKAIFQSFAGFNRKSRFRDVKFIYDIDPQSII
jgi:primosomal protein N' (replication factor Y) (superfamily II helicase)